MADPRPRRSTRTDEVTGRLRREILDGTLLPGRRLKFPDLAARYGASVGVIRESLVTLVEHGLVTSQPRLGFTVTSVTQAGLDDLGEARTEIEVFVLRRAIADGDLDWESRALAAHHRFERTPLAGAGSQGAGTEGAGATDRVPAPDGAWLEAHAAFHTALLAGCANRRLLAMAASLRDETELYRRWSRPRPGAPTEASDRVASDEHRSLLQAALARDADAAEVILRRLMAYSSSLEVVDVDPGGGGQDDAQGGAVPPPAGD